MEARVCTDYANNLRRYPKASAAWLAQYFGANVDVASLQAAATLAAPLAVSPVQVDHVIGMAGAPLPGLSAEAPASGVPAGSAPTSAAAAGSSLSAPEREGTADQEPRTLTPVPQDAILRARQIRPQ